MYCVMYERIFCSVCANASKVHAQPQSFIFKLFCIQFQKKNKCKECQYLHYSEAKTISNALLKSKRHKLNIETRSTALYFLARGLSLSFDNLCEFTTQKHKFES